MGWPAFAPAVMMGSPQTSIPNDPAIVTDRPVVLGAGANHDTR